MPTPFAISVAYCGGSLATPTREVRVSALAVQTHPALKTTSCIRLKDATMPMVLSSC